MNSVAILACLVTIFHYGVALYPIGMRNNEENGFIEDLDDDAQKPPTDVWEENEMPGYQEEIEEEDQHVRQKRAFPREGANWKKVGNELVIPFVIDPKFPVGSWQHTKILQRVKEMNSFIKCNKNVWRPRKNEKGYILFRSNKKGCNSLVGQSKRNKEQHINLPNWCIRGSGLLHEMLHAMGYYHELDRPDRYKSLKVIWDNVKPEAKSKMNPKAADPLFNHGKLDFDSIMMAGQYVHAKKGSKHKRAKTLVAISPADQKIFDHRDHKKGLSETDKEVLNKYYGCGSFPKEGPTFVTVGACKEYDWCADAVKNQPELCTGRRTRRNWRRKCKISCKACKGKNGKN